MLGSLTRRAAVIGVTLAVAATLASDVRADEHGGRHGRGHLLGYIERGVERLELTAETKQGIYAVLDAARSEQRALADQRRAARQQMRAVLDAPSPSLDAVLAQADSMGALDVQARKIELTALVKVRGLLTDEQWQQLRPPRRPS